MAGWWFSLGTLVTSTNKADSHDITEILLKVVLNTITLSPKRRKLDMILMRLTSAVKLTVPNTAYNKIVPHVLVLEAPKFY